MKLHATVLAAVVTASAAAFAATPVAAHEMFLKSEGHVLPPESAQVVRLLNGTFDMSENVVERDRMADVSVVAHGRVAKPAAGDWFDEGDTSALNWRAAAPGTYVIGVSTRPRIITMAAKDFAAYLKHDGVLDTLEAFARDNRLENVRERYSKHVRAIVQVGDVRTADYATLLGYPVEIVPTQNPYDLRFGKELSFQVLHRGKPLANQLVYASYEGFHAHDESGEHITSYTLRTDADGRAKLLLSNKALWYLSLIHMQRLVDDKDADYESNWATLTFSVK